MDYKELVSDIKELSEKLTIIEGIVDLRETIPSYNNEIEYKMVDYDNSFWILLGKSNYDDIGDCLKDERFDKRNDGLIGEGEYHFHAVLKYDGDDNDYCGYWYIDYIEFHFQQTFLEREREYKLNTLLDDNLDIFS